MLKQEFLDQLSAKLSGLPKAEIQERLNFYHEMICDRMEEGISEQDAVAELGDIQDIASQIIQDIPLTRLAKEKIKSQKSLKGWEITLLAVGSPLWLSLLIAVLAVVFSVYISLWAVIVSLWATFGALVGCGVGGVIAGIIFALQGQVLTGLATLGGGLVSAGMAIFMFFACKVATRWLLRLTGWTILAIKRSFMLKEAHHE